MVSILPQLLLSLLILSSTSIPGASVAIFDGGADFPYYGAPDMLEPERLAANLEKIGIQADILDAAELSDPEKFNIQRYTTMIHIYGNTFPLVAAENIRKFHQAGGSILTTGVPFCHPCVAMGAADWSARWDEGVSLTEESRTGNRALKIVHKTGNWTGLASRQIPTSAGKQYRIAGYSRASVEAQGRDNLFVRFFDSSGSFIGQYGPQINASENWRKISEEVKAPDEAKWLDVSPQVWTKGAIVFLDDISLTDIQNGKQLLENGGFEQPGGEWRDLGHTNDWFDAQKGMGMGSFGGPISSENSVVRLEKDEPLGLSGLGVPSEARRPAQWLDAASLPAGSAVEGILGVYEGDKFRGYTVALIRTPKGTVDLWAGSTPGISRLYDEFLMRQILVRGVVLALVSHGSWTETQRDEAFGKLDALPRPRDIENLAEPDEPRPYPTFFPKSPAPAEKLLIVDVRPLPPDEKILLTSLQGLVNRDKPRIYLLFSVHDQRWLDWLKQTGRVKSEELIREPSSLIQRFKEHYSGAVIPDPDLYMGHVIACNVSGAQDLLITSERLASQLDLPVKQDLRGRFKDNASALEWVSEELFDQLSHHLLICAHPNLAYNGSFDYIIQHRGIAFWLTGRVDNRRPDSDAIAEQEVMESLFARLPVNIPVRGFWWHGHGVGPGEGPGVTLGSRFGKVTVVSDGMANLSVHSGYTLQSLKQKSQPPDPKLDRDKVYFTFTMSDGDNLNTLFQYFTGYFEDEHHGAFPMGWGVGPTIIDLAPAVIEWYYQNAAPTDEFFCDVSGVGYIYPPQFAAKYRDRDAVLDDYLSWTQKYMDRLDLHTVRPMGTDEAHILRYGERLKGIHSLLPDYGRGAGGDLSRSTYMLPNGTPVFRGFTNWQEGNPDPARYMADQIQRQVGDQRPAFINVFVWNWGYRMETLKQVLDLLPRDYVPVTPAQLSRLYQQTQF